MKRVHVASLCLCSHLVASSTASQTPFTVPGLNSHSDDKVLTPEFGSFVDDVLLKWNSPGGVAVAFVRQDTNTGEWQTEAKGYGNARADGTKMSEDSLFSIASNSKLFTILSTGLLISNESLTPRISWDTKIASLFPEWKELSDPFLAEQADIVDLMSHRTGYPRHDFSYTLNDTLPTLWSRLKQLRMSTEFRYSVQYNNIMYQILSYLPGKIVGTTYGRYVKEHIFDPLGMTSTTYSVSAAKSSGKLADGFGREGLDPRDPLVVPGRNKVYPFYDDAGLDGNMNSGAGGVISSASDLTIWLKTLLLSGRNPTTNISVIPSEVIEKVASGITVFEPKAEWPELSPISYGGGQMRGSYRGHEYIEHGGAVPGYMTQIIRIPSLHLGVAVLSNDDVFGTNIHTIVKWRLLDTILGLPVIDWSERLRRKVEENARAIPTPIPRPDEAKLPRNLSFESLAGRYDDGGGYGPIDLCYLNGSDSLRSTCGAPDVVESGDNTPTLVFPKENVWISYVKLSHFDGAVFNASAWVPVPAVNSSADPTPQRPYDGLWLASGLVDMTLFTAEFAFSDDGLVEGFGLRGGVWGAGKGVPRPEGHRVQERSEVWFEKI